MHEFYFWPWQPRLFLTFLFALCVLTQTLAFIFSRYRTGRNRLYPLESVLEFVLLLQIFVLSLLHGQVYHGLAEGHIVPSGYLFLRRLCFLALVLASGGIAYEARKPGPLRLILPALVLLPAAEAATGRAYPWLFLLSLIALLIRGIRVGLRSYRQIQSGLSALSVKETIDNLHTGLLFGRPDGRIVLMNAVMQRLMIAVTGTIYRDGKRFYEELISDRFAAVRERGQLEGQTVFLLADGSAWMFSKADLAMDGKPYMQLTATEVGERFRLTAELRERDLSLRAKSEELKVAIAQLHTLSREREVQRAKMRAHDVLGQRLTLLLRMMRGDQPMELDMLQSLSADLLEQLTAEPSLPTPAEELAHLGQIFRSIGVAIHVDGALPAEDAKARLLMDVIRESVANAVRHGFATEVFIQARQEDGAHRLRIDNNGHPPAETLTEGGGISAMRERLKEGGGTLDIVPSPRFTVSAILPGGDV